MYLSIWQLAVCLILTAAFAYRLGFVHGEGHAWNEIDNEQEQEPVQ